VRERVLHMWNSWPLFFGLGLPTLKVTFKNGTKLSGANLNRANLRRADLSDANLERANLKEADLTRADLTRANLKEANLTEATMSKAKRTIVVIHLGRYFPIGSFTTDYLAWADLEKVSPFSIEVQRLSTTEAKNLLTRAKNRLEKSDRNKTRLPAVLLKPACLTVVTLKVEAADLTGADLSGTNLRKAIITHEQLGKAKLLEDATMPDGSKHP